MAIAQPVRILTGVLDGSEQVQNVISCSSNAAAGFVITHLADDLTAGLELARDQIGNGAALAKLRAMVAFR